MRSPDTASVIRSLALASVALLLVACGEPSGPDLVFVECLCTDEALGANVPIEGRVCTDSSDPGELADAAQTRCDSKETICFPDCYGIENCGVTSTFVEAINGCPGGHSENAGGDFGQTLSQATESIFEISGDDINSFSVSPEELLVRTTQTGSNLEFADITGFVSEATFDSDGFEICFPPKPFDLFCFGVGGGEHTLTDVNLLLTEAFSVPLEADGGFVIPDGTGQFILTGLLDGGRTALGGSTEMFTGIYDEEAAVFEMSGAVQADDADITVNLALSFEFLNRPPRARAGPDQVVECDSPAQTGTAQLSAADSFDLDGDEDIVRFSWTADFGVPDPQVAVGEEVDMALALGGHVVTLAVADQSGSFGVDSTDITVQDVTPPLFAVSQPQPIEYPHSATLILDYAAEDACHEVALLIALLNGSDMLAGHGLASGQAIHLLTELPLGSHTFTLDAADELGNAASTSVVFTLVVTPESIADAVMQFLASGQISNRGLAKALLRQLDAAAEARINGNCTAAGEIYRAFIATLGAQRSRSVDADAVAILIGDAQFLISNCP